MKSKNDSDQICNSRFCPVGTYVSNQPVKKQTTPIKALPKQQQALVKPKFEASNDEDYSQQRLIPVDKNQLNRNRNRLLREQLDAKRQDELDYQQYKDSVKPVIHVVEPNGPPEAIKMRLLVMMGKFRDLNFDYKYLSQYFEACFKRLALPDGDAAILESFLIFDKIDLADSAQCYLVALKGIDKTQTSRYSKLGSVVDGLAAILKDLQ